VADQTDRAPADNDNGWRLGRVAASDSQSALQLTLSSDSDNACWITSNTTAATQQLWTSFCKQRQPQLTGTYDNLLFAHEWPRNNKTKVLIIN